MGLISYIQAKLGNGYGNKASAYKTLDLAIKRTYQRERKLDKKIGNESSRAKEFEQYAKSYYQKGLENQAKNFTKGYVNAERRVSELEREKGNLIQMRMAMDTIDVEKNDDYTVIKEALKVAEKGGLIDNKEYEAALETLGAVTDQIGDNGFINEAVDRKSVSIDPEVDKVYQRFVAEVNADNVAVGQIESDLEKELEKSKEKV